MDNSIFWFRRDLRIEDNHGLFHALNSPNPVLPIFIFDTNILNDLSDKTDRRVSFIHERIAILKDLFNQKDSDLLVFFDEPETVFTELIEKYSVKAIYTNHDYEPYAIKRDLAIKHLVEKSGIEFYSYKDQVLLEKKEVVKADESPYTVFTPYMRKWKTQIQNVDSEPFPSENKLNNLAKHPPTKLVSLSKLGFKWIDHLVRPLQIDEQLIKNYHETRDFPSINGTSRLSVHLRFGTIGIRTLYQQIKNWNETFLNELIWREFYMMILWHFPNVVDQSFKPQYDRIQWNKSERDFELWCTGKTGYPIVDAGMHQLLKTGYMHNRVRMITASFLTKHLLIDWRKGEAFFARHLTDYELASNNGGWQWASGSGCDAAPYFRIFNPYTQAKKFDPEGKYIQQWMPNEIIPPIIEHPAARDRCLRTYKSALNAE